MLSEALVSVEQVRNANLLEVICYVPQDISHRRHERAQRRVWPAG